MVTTTAAVDVATIVSPLLSARKAAALCSLGLSTWWRYHSAGKIPSPVRIGGSVRWRHAELHDWMDANCPPREKWEAMTNIRAAKR